MNINRTRLLKIYNTEKTEELDQLIEELNKSFQQRHNDYLDTGKDKTTITKISCLGQTARNFITVLRRRIPMWIMHQVEKNWRTSGEKYMRKKFNIMDRWAG